MIERTDVTYRTVRLDTVKLPRGGSRSRAREPVTDTNWTALQLTFRFPPERLPVPNIRHGDRPALMGVGREWNGRALFPCLVYVHGGGGVLGQRTIVDRERQAQPTAVPGSSVANPLFLPGPSAPVVRLAKHFANRGFVFCAVQFRGRIPRERLLRDALEGRTQTWGGVPWGQFPAAVQDVRQAFRFVRSLTGSNEVPHEIYRKYIDHSRMGLVGTSSGGRIAALAALWNPKRLNLAAMFAHRRCGRPPPSVLQIPDEVNFDAPPIDGLVSDAKVQGHVVGVNGVFEPGVVMIGSNPVARTYFRFRDVNSRGKNARMFDQWVNPPTTLDLSTRQEVAPSLASLQSRHAAVSPMSYTKSLNACDAEVPELDFRVRLPKFLIMRGSGDSTWRRGAFRGLSSLGPLLNSIRPLERLAVMPRASGLNWRRHANAFAPLLGGAGDGPSSYAGHAGWGFGGGTRNFVDLTTEFLRQHVQDSGNPWVQTVAAAKRQRAQLARR